MLVNLLADCIADLSAKLLCLQVSEFQKWNDSIHTAHFSWIATKDKQILVACNCSTAAEQFTTAATVIYSGLLSVFTCSWKDVF